MLLKERLNEQVVEEEEVSSYWITLRKREVTGSRKKKH
jgi:hypothetical protein